MKRGRNAGQTGRFPYVSFPFVKRKQFLRAVVGSVAWAATHPCKIPENVQSVPQRGLRPKSPTFRSRETWGTQPRRLIAPKLRYPPRDLAGGLAAFDAAVRTKSSRFL